jgi:release factor glutamine methyltransferase
LLDGFDVTTVFPDLYGTVVADAGVYAPQHDSRLLVDAVMQSGLATGRRVLDLCTGSGVVAIAAARQAPAAVIAFDICPRAERCARANARAAGVDVEVRVGSLTDALACGPFDVVLCNPPYVPAGPDAHTELIAPDTGAPWAWNAGRDGRLVLDPLCERSSELLVDGGTMLLAQSELSGVEQSLALLRSAGLTAEVCSRQRIPFGPVLSARAHWLQSTGRIRPGYREEHIVVIRADKR